MKIWIDKWNKAPTGYIRCHTNDEACDTIIALEQRLDLLREGGVIGKNELLFTEISVNINDDFRDLVKWMMDTERKYPLVYHESEQLMTYFIGSDNSSGIKCDSWDKFIESLKKERDRCVKMGMKEFSITIESNPHEVCSTESAVVTEEYLKDLQSEGICCCKPKTDMMFG